MIGRSPPVPPLRAVRSRLQLGGCGGSSNPLRLLLAGTVLAVALVGLGGRVGAVSAALGAARHSKREAASGPAVTLSGRFFPGPSPDGVARLPQLMTWGASAISLSFSGSPSVEVVINGSLEALPEQDRMHSLVVPEFPRSYFKFEMGGRTAGRGYTSRDAPVLTWRRNGLWTGQHILTITKLSEARTGGAWLQSASLAAGGRFLPPPPEGAGTGRRILFIGDSYTAGMGNTGPPNCRRFDIARFTDGLLAYGPVAARSLRADYQLIAWSGAGLNHYRQLGMEQWPKALRRAASPRMTDLLHASDPLDPDSTYDLSSWVPQVVVMAAGTNDFQAYSLSGEHHVVPAPFALPTLQQWGDEYVAFIQELRAAFPEAAIINLVWPLEVQLVGVKTLPQTAVYLQYMARAFTRLQQAGLSNTHFLQLDGDVINTTAFCMAHPDVGTHRDVARQLVEFISAVLPEFAKPAQRRPP
ncbi:hypothetical protein ABPG77_003426 [Micractinium sp. CCAP 211/92]